MIEPIPPVRPRRKWPVVVAILVLLPGFGAFAGATWSKLVQTDWPQPVEEHFVTTEDGWRLHVARIRPAGPPAETPPVLLVHGLSTNGRNLDFDLEHSPARFLANRGFDVFVPSLRGTGKGRSGPSDSARDFDAFVTHDLPALMSLVRSLTGSEEVDYVGHSMGGMIGYAHLASEGCCIRRLVTLGSPVRFGWDGTTGALLSRAITHADIAGHLPIRLGSLLVGPLHGLVEGPLETLIVDLDNVSPRLWRRFLAVGVEDIPTDLARQFARWIREGRFDSQDGSIDYLGGLGTVTTPALVIAGAADGIAAPELVKPAFDALGGLRFWHVVGQASGASVDYNHMDLVLAANASHDVFVRVADFLAAETEEQGEPVVEQSTALQPPALPERPRRDLLIDRAVSGTEGEWP